MFSKLRVVFPGVAVALLIGVLDGCAGAQTSGKVVTGNPHPGYCPVMGEEVDMEKAADNPNLYSDHEGKRYYLCCKQCKPDFDKEPAKWIAHPAAPQKD